MNTSSTVGRGIPAGLAVCLLCFLAAMPAAAALPEEENKLVLRRFALIVGANNGGKDRVRLQYAQTDARALNQVLLELGGVARKDSKLLLDPTREELVKNFGIIRGRLLGAQWQGVRVEVVFYFSGHSDETGLLLAGEHFTYKEIRRELDEMPADVRIGVLDSCASGTLTRRKGGIWRAPFLVDESAQVHGHAFLTSSSADEAAQESDRVGGSFFTHYMVSGLRGAADVSQDGRVTLSEAYQYAFNETLARTESTQAGPQHPNYDFQLTGAGDLVLTDVRGTSALLVLPEELEGRLFIRDDEGRLVAEINKPAGRTVSFGLEPGEYTVTSEKKPELLKGTFKLAKGKETVLNLADLHPLEAEVTVARGDDKPEEDKPDKPEEDIPDKPVEGEPEPDVESGQAVKVVPFNIGLVPYVSTNALKKGRLLNNISLNILLGSGQVLKGVELSALGAIRTEDSSGLMASGVFNAGLGKFTGLQGSGIANYNRELLAGVQAAAVANYARSARGAQVGSFNVAGSGMKGLQAGIGNYAAEIRGVQFGIFNISRKMTGIPIGLINFAGDGMLALEFWYSETSLFNMGLKMGSRWFYTILGSSIQPEGANVYADDDSEYYTLIAGLGGHIRLSKRWWVDIDVLAHRLVDEYQAGSPRLDLLAKLRVALGFRVFSSLSLFIGPSLNFVASEVRKGAGIRYALFDESDDELHYMLNGGFFFGFQISPTFGELNAW